MIKTAKDFGKAIKDGEDWIEVEGDFWKKVVKIKATGDVAWAVACGAISVAVITVLTKASTAGVSTPITAPAALFGGSAASQYSWC